MESAGQALHAASAFAIAGDAEGGAGAANAALACLNAMFDPVGSAFVRELDSLALSCERVVKAAEIIAARTTRMNGGPSAVIDMTRALGGDFCAAGALMALDGFGDSALADAFNG